MTASAVVSEVFLEVVFVLENIVAKVRDIVLAVCTGATDVVSLGRDVVVVVVFAVVVV